MFVPDSMAPPVRADNTPVAAVGLPGPMPRGDNSPNGFREQVSLRFYLLCVLTICVVVSLGTIGLKSSHSGLTASWPGPANEDNLDQRLTRAATSALGSRRGTVIVMDPQTGRVRVVVNSEMAFEESLPPGSTIKPFTTLAALRSGVIDENSHTLCGEKYSHDGFQTMCSHPRDLPPLNPTEAIAYSCNYYFGKVGERLDESSFDSTLSEFGFGKNSGINVAREGLGKLPHDGWHSQNAIGDSDELQATPIQLIGAYSALVNGGHLFTPRVASARNFSPQLRAHISIKDEYRSLIVRGMRGAVRYGTAETAGLYSLPVYIFGKTGTATQINGFRSQGWFVGFASPIKSSAHASVNNEPESAPENVKLAVLVFLTKAHGSEAAQVARPVFEEYSRVEKEDPANSDAGQQPDTPQAEIKRDTYASTRFPLSGPVAVSTAVVRVHLVRENITRNISLEDYVTGVVATEGSTETEPEALKALAIAARSYAVKNIGRHAAEGYDFCTTTHCQRYREVDPDSGSVASSGALRAIQATKGEMLLDGMHQVADSYFSASCGGATANLTALWGAKAPPYLRGVADEYCAGDAHHQWTDVISEKQLLKAMQSDSRTNVGNRLADVRVARQDSSGRAATITLEGERRLTVRGWDFKIIVGRALGWNLLKSSRFEVARSGSNFVFRGSGFGHGLGLCQEGAHVMALRGANYRQILGKYFPGIAIGTDVQSLNWNKTAGDAEKAFMSIPAAVRRPRTFADLVWGNHAALAAGPPRVTQASRLTLRSEDFRINYPGSVDRREIEALLRFLQLSQSTLCARTAGAGLVRKFPAVELYLNETTGDFVGRTGQPPWVSAATRGNRIELQPLETLRRRRILETTLRHELVHALVDRVGHGHTPRWLAEGLAIHMAGEGRMVASYEPSRHWTTDEIDAELIKAKSAGDMKVAYAAAYREVKRLISKEGEANVWRRVAN